MGDRFDALQPEQREFIQRQKLFFVGTAGSEGSVNVSPKGMDTLRVLAPDRVAWLNLTGSGNETATHVQENPRMTVMFCSFDRQPLILRLYGEAQVIHSGDARWSEMIGLFPGFTGARQVFDLSIRLVQNSCGFGVPMYDLREERPTLGNWAEKKGREGVRTYWKERNAVSLDGRDTGIVDRIGE